MCETQAGIYFVVDRRAREVGLERHIHLHLLRQTSATWLANADIQEGELRALMGCDLVCPRKRVDPLCYSYRRHLE